MNKFVRKPDRKFLKDHSYHTKPRSSRRKGSTRILACENSAIQTSSCWTSAISKPC